MSPYCLTLAAVRLHLRVLILAVLVRNKSKPRYSWLRKNRDKKEQKKKKGEFLDEKACAHNRKLNIQFIITTTKTKTLPALQTLAPTTWFG
jgi:hypothetical protein